MKTTLIDNWKTSLVGLALIGAGLYTGLTAKQNWTESGPVILAGTGLIFSKDAKKNPESIMKNAIEKTTTNE